MNCKHKPASYGKMLTEGDAGMICRYCRKPIRSKDKARADLIRRLLVLVPIILFCVLIVAELPIGKIGLVACFIASLMISIIGWLIVCRFFLEYEEVPEMPADEAPAQNNT